MTKSDVRILLIQPQMGISGEFSRHLPLSLLYVAAALDKLAEVEIFDTRVIKEDWRKLLIKKLDKNYTLIGFTVMSGTPVAHSLEMTRLIKQHCKSTVVWGGALPTVAPEAVMKENSIDFCVSGSGIQAIRELVTAITDNKTNDEKTLTKIPGLSFRKEQNIVHNPAFQGFEPIHFSQIPYHLIEDYSVYGQIGCSERIFPIYSAYGCPYQCSFCISPAHYRNFPKKWVPVDPEEVIAHIEYLKTNYQAEKIYFYDDDSFVSIEHIRKIILGLKKRNLNLKLGFRGARVNEIKLMDQDFLTLLADTGTDMLHIGIESGSQPILDLYRKGISIEDIFLINRKLAKNNRIIAGYNWIVGTPGETAKDIKKTAALMLELVKTNSLAFIFQPNVFRVVPGSELEAAAVKLGYIPPATLEDYIKEETEQKFSHPWFNEEVEKLIRMLQITSYFVDHKAEILLKTTTAKNLIIRLASLAYRPLARYRFSRGFSEFLLEEPFFELGQKLNAGKNI